MIFASAVAESLIAPKIVAPGLLAKRAVAVLIRLITAYAPAVKWRLTEKLTKTRAIMPVIAAAERQGIVLLIQLILMAFAEIGKNAILIPPLLLANHLALAVRENIAIRIVCVKQPSPAMKISLLPLAMLLMMTYATMNFFVILQKVVLANQIIALTIRLNVPNRLIAARENIAILLLAYVR
jgi:hypothetical protein